MKSILFCILFLVIFSSCSSNSKENSIDDSTKSYAKGKEIYQSKCTACHMDDGKGINKVFPPLAESDFLLNNINQSIDIIINGYQGNMTVNNEEYNGIMPPQNLTDKEVVEVMNYILNAWGNNGGEISLEDVKAAKK